MQPMPWIPQHYAWYSQVILQDYPGSHLCSGRTTVRVLFCGVQIFINFMGIPYPPKNYICCVRVIRPYATKIYAYKIFTSQIIKMLSSQN